MADEPVVEVADGGVGGTRVPLPGDAAAQEAAELEKEAAAKQAEAAAANQAAQTATGATPLKTAAQIAQERAAAIAAKPVAETVAKTAETGGFWNGIRNGAGRMRAAFGGEAADVAGMSIASKAGLVGAAVVAGETIASGLESLHDSDPRGNTIDAYRQKLLSDVNQLNSFWGSFSIGDKDLDQSVQRLMDAMDKSGNYNVTDDTKGARKKLMDDLANRHSFLGAGSWVVLPSTIKNDVNWFLAAQDRALKPVKQESKPDAKPPELTPEEKAKFLDSIKSPWDTAKELVRALRKQDSDKIVAELPAKVKEILGIDDTMDADGIRAALRDVLKGNMPSTNKDRRWESEIYIQGIEDSKRPAFAQTIKQLAEAFQADAPKDGKGNITGAGDLMKGVRTAMGKAPVQAAPGGVTGGNEKPAAGTPAAPTAAAQQLAAENAQLKQALEQETAAMNDMKAAMDKIGPQLQADQVTIRNLGIDKNALVHGLDSTEASIGLNDAIHMTKHHGFLYHINPVHLFTHDNPLKNKNFVAITTAAQAQGGQDPNFMKYAVEMYNTKGSGPEKPAIIGMATTLDNNENLFVGVNGVLAARQAAAVRQNPQADRSAVANNTSQANILGQDMNPNGSFSLASSAPLTRSSPQPARQVYNPASTQQPDAGALAATVNGAAPQQAATSQPQNQPAPAPV